MVMGLKRKKHTVNEKSNCVFLLSMDNIRNAADPYKDIREESDVDVEEEQPVPSFAEAV
jgi:hypothetical protein